ncbi:hypothetical protein HQQ80_01220 [Microbacteriaceae bacterium VKM Ac-2855]|nr:hypothetical protein [Microbacteriaceae bacterium VKM Ac-2855]
MSEHAAVGAGRRERVDGNAVAGLLEQLLVGDATLMTGECSGCRARAPLAQAIVELDPEGAIVMCRTCSHTLFTVLTRAGVVQMEIAGLRSIAVGTTTL